MDLVPQLLLEALLLGGFYAFMAIGFSLVWGVLGILNLAYGSFLIVGAYIAYILYNRAGVDPLLSLPFVFAVGFTVGFLLQKFLLGKLSEREPFMILIMTFGIDMFLSHLVNLIFGADIRSIDVPYAEGSFILGNLIISKVKLITFIISLFLTFALFIFLKVSWTGRAIRAVALDVEGAKLVGINPLMIFSITMGIGTGVAMAAGNLFGVLQGFNPFEGGPITVRAFLISIIGGLGRIESALVGGLFLGVLEVFISFNLGESWKMFASLFLMVVILILKPRGLFGGKYYG